VAKPRNILLCKPFPPELSKKHSSTFGWERNILRDLFLINFLKPADRKFYVNLPMVAQPQYTTQALPDLMWKFEIYAIRLRYEQYELNSKCHCECCSQ